MGMRVFDWKFDVLGDNVTMERRDARAARLRGFLAADPGNVDLACELADELITTGDYAQARSVLEALPGAEHQPGVQFRKARILMILGDYAAAETAYETLISAGHASTAVWHDLAFSQLCQRKPDAALASLQHGVRSGVTPALWVLQARINLMQAQYDDALRVLDEALILQPDDEAALGVRALALLDAGKPDMAAVAARDCLQRYPDQHEALLVGGTLALWSQHLDAAQGLFQRALARHPNSGRALSGLGQVLMLRGDLAGARAELEHAVQAMPDHIGTWHALAWACLLQGNRDAAEASYRSAFALDRNFGDSHGGLALIDALRGDFDSAEQGIKRALRLDPNAVTARYAQTLVLAARGDHAASEAAMAELTRATGSELPVAEFAARLKAILGGGDGT